MKSCLVVPETTLSSSFFLPCRHWYSPAAGTWAGKLSTCDTTASVRVPVFFLGYACLWMQLGRFLLRSVVLGFVPFQLGFTNHPQAPCFSFYQEEPGAVESAACNSSSWLGGWGAGRVETGGS